MLKTDRLILRPWRKDDREPFARMGQNADVMRHFPGFMSREASDAFIDRQMAATDEKGYALWAAELREGSRFVGFVGIQDVPDYYQIPPAIEIGWRLCNSVWGQGLAPEGAKACLAFAFSKLNAPEVVAFTATINKPSQRVMEKIGMTRDMDGDFDHPKIDKSHAVCRHVLYRIKAGEAR